MGVREYFSYIKELAVSLFPKLLMSKSLAYGIHDKAYYFLKSINKSPIDPKYFGPF